MHDYSIIVVVALIAFLGCGIMALAVYFVDKNVDRHDRNPKG
jgi:hypothetical protein